MSDVGNVGIHIDTDGSERDVADEIADALEKRLKGSAGPISRAVASDLRKAFGAGGKGPLTSFNKTADQAFRKISAGAKSAAKDVDFLEARLKTLVKTFSGVGADPRGFLVDPDLVRRGTAQLDILENKREEIARDKTLERGLRTETSAIMRLLETQAKEVSNLARVYEESSRRQRETTIRSQQSATIAARAAASERIVAAQQEGARIVAETRAAGARRVAIIQAVAAQVRALERGLGAVFRQTSRAFSALGSAAARGLSGLGSAIRRSNSQMTAGFGPALSRRESILRTSFSRQERLLSSSISRQTTIIQRFQAQAQRGFAGAVGGGGPGAGLIGGGLAAGGGLLALLTSGFRRFSELERIQKQFTALLRDEQQALFLIAQLKDFAKITPFDLVGVSDLAKGFLAIGFAAKDVLPAVKTISDAVALTGGGTDELVRIQRAIGQVVAAGRLQGDELNQLAENLPGLNIRQLLADQLTGGDQRALVELQEAGELSADMFLSGLLEGLSSDPRLVGAAEDLSKTLSGRLANLREAFADFGASLIGLVAEPLAALFGQINTALASAAQFIRGEDLSETLETIRVAAAGAAIAIGGLIVARVAGEAMQFLVLGLRAALTPFGLIALALGAIGAIVAVAVRRFPGLRLAFEQIGDTLSTAVAPILEFFQERLEELSTFITTIAIPAIAEFGAEMITRLVGAARVVGEFFTNTILPALQRFVDFIRNSLIPDVQFRARAAFRLLGAGVRLFWAVAEPVLQPAISRLGDLVDAVKELFDLRPSRGLLAIGGVLASAVAGFAVAGPLGATIAGLGATIGALFATGLNDEVFGVLQGLGTIIVNALEPVVSTVVSTLSRVFSVRNLINVAEGFLVVVERIGEIIGSIISDPRVIAAVAGIAFFAVRIGIAFVKGFAQGVIENLPELGELILDGIKALFDIDPNAIFVGLFALLGSAAVISRFRQSGQAFGKAIADGTRQSLTVGGAGFGAGPRGFIEGLLGSVGGASREARRVGDAVLTEFIRTNRLLRAAGRQPIEFIGTDLEENLRRSRGERSRLIGDLGAARVAGLEVRSAIGSIGTAIRQLDLGGVRAGFGDLRASLSGQGRNIGAAAGTAIAASLGVAFSAQMVVEGRGIGDTAAGIAGIIGSSLGAFALGGPIVGAASLGLGAITAALLGNQEAAERAKNEVKEYAEALRDAEGAEVGLSAAETVLRNIGDEAVGVQDVLLQVGFDAEAFAERIISGSSSASEEFARFVESAIGDVGGFADIIRREGIGSMEELNKFLASEGGFGRFREVIRGAGFDVEDFITAIDAVTDESGELRSGLDQVARTNAFEQLAGGAEAAAQRVRNSLGAPNLFEIRAAGVSGVAKVLEDNVEQPADDAKQALQEAKQALDDLLTGGIQTSFQGALDEFIAGLPQLRQQLQETLGVDADIVQRAQLSLDTAGIKEQLSEVVQRGIVDGTIRSVPDVESALTDLKTKVKLAIPPGPVRAEILGVIDAVIDSLGTQEGLDLMEALGLEVTEQDRRNAAVAAGEIVGGFAEGLSSGLPPEVQAAMASALEAFRSGASSPVPGAVGTQLGRGVVGGIESEQGNVAGAAMAATQGAVNQSIEVARAGVGVGFTFASSVAAGIGAAEHQVAGAGESVGGAAVAGAAGGSGGAYGIGLSISFGLAAGINAGASAAISAAISLAQRAISAARSALQIRSPSQVFRDIGHEIGTGLALGLAESETGIVSAMQSAIDKAIEAATDQAAVAIGRARGAVAIFQALLPGRLPGQASNVDIERARIAVQDTIQSFIDMQREVRETIADLKDQIAESNKTIAEAHKAFREGAGGRAAEAFARTQQRVDINLARGELRFAVGRGLREQVGDLRRQIEEARRTRPADRTREQRILAGERGTSLAAGSLVGRQNRQFILEAGQSIRDFGRQLLEAGTPVQDVVKQMQEMRNNLIATTRSLGFNQKQVQALLGTLGLTDAQLKAFKETVRRANQEAAAERDAIIREARTSINEALVQIRRLTSTQISLSLTTEQGRRNRAALLDMFQGVRDLGRELLDAGVPVADVVRQMKELRNQVLATARAMGFNQTQLMQLVATLGLTDAQLAEFMRQINMLNKTPATPPPGSTLPPPIVQIYPPYGDPEAIGLTTVNRLTMALF